MRLRVLVRRESRWPPTRHATASRTPGTASPSPPPLEATIVHYRSGPDRCTVAPGDVSDERRLTAWLSVDADALVRLGEMR